MKAASQARRKPVLEEIEPRILYAADFSPGLLAAAPSLLGVEHRTLDAGGEFATRQQSTPQQQATRHEVVFVDTATPDYQKLVDDIKAQSGGDRRLDVVLLDPNVDGIKQISATLTGMKEVSAVHLIGHGADGQIELGGDTLNFDSLLKNASQIKGWGQALTQDADVLIYGCDVAEHADGKALVEALARLTGADVAASENLTGAADRGGDWTLEFSTGHLETALAVSAAERQAYQGVLLGTAVGGETLVNTTTAGTQTTVPNPQRAVAIDANGNYVVVWSGNGPGDAAGIFAQRFNASGVAQGSEFRVNTTTTNAQTQPSVAMDANGNFVVAWTTAAGGSGTGVHAQRFNAAGVAQGSEILVNTFTTGDQNTPSIAMNASGAFVIVWTSDAQDGSGDGVYAQRYNSAGVAQGAELPVNSTTTGDQDLDSVAIDASGNFLITWASNLQDGSANGIYSRRFDSAGAALTGEVAVNTTTSGDQFYSSSAMNASGDYVVTWTSMNQDGASGGIYGRRYDSGGVAQGVEFRVNSTTAGDQEYSNVSMDSIGNFVVTWSSNDQDAAGTWGIYKQEYTADGTANNGEIKINTTIAGDQLYSSVAMNASRNFVVVWSGAGVGDADGVFAQRYDSLNEAPAGTNNTVTTLEDTAYTFLAADFGFADPNDIPANALLAVKISTIPGAGTLALSGVAVTVGQTLLLADITAGNLKFTPAANANGSGYASFTFQVQDDGGTANSGVDLDQSPNTMSVNVTAVNDAPAGTNNTVTTLEDTAYTFLAADFGFTDPDDSPANALTAVKISTIPGAGTLALSGVAVIVGQTVSLADITAGNLKFTPAANANGSGYASFNFQVQDDGGTANSGVDLDQSPNTMTIDATAVNDAPAGTNNTVTTLEDTVYTFAAADFGFTDPDDSPANALLVVKISAIPGAGTLALSGTAVTVGQTVSLANITAGNLKFTPAADVNGSGYASFTFQVQDDGGTANSGVDLDQSPNTMTIDATAVNDAPAGTDNTVTTLEDSVYTFTAVDFGFTDPNDSPANALTAVKISTIPGAGTLALSGVAVTVGQTVSVANIIAGNLKFTPGVDANGAAYASFTFQVQDDGGTSNGGVDLDQSAKTMTIDVTAVNDAPAGTDNTITTLEDSAYIFASADFGFSDTADTPANALSAVKITTLLGGGVLTNNGALVNAGDFVAAADIASGKLVFTPGADANGAGYASFTFQVQDDGLTANGGVDLDPSAKLMTIDVTAVNDAPAGTNNTVTTLEDNAYTFASADFGFSDAADSPSNALSAVKITTLPGAGSLTDNGVLVNAGDFVAAADIASGKLVFTPGADANGAGYASFTFQVQDDGGTANGGVDLDQSPNTMTIDVTVVNDAPVGTDNTITTLEDTAYTFAAVDFGFSDPTSSPANSLLAVEITTLPGAGTLTDNGVAVTAGQLVTALDIASGKLMFTPMANANGAGYASFTFQVQDDGGIANGGVDLDPIARALDINVTPLNDAPAGTDSTVTTLEDSDYVFSASAFGFTDTGDAPTDAFFAVRITSLSSAGSLLLSGAAVSAGQMISVANINAGNLVFSPAPNANGAGYASFTFQVQDNGGTANGAVDTDPTARTLSIDVSAVNDAPVLENNALSVRQGGSVILSGANLSAADADTPATGLIFTLSNVLDGQFELVSGPGVAITSFTQANVTAGQVLFVQDGSANSPAYDVMLSDGTLSVGPRAGSVGFSLVPTGAAGGGLLVAPFVPAAPPAASSNALPPAPAPAPAPVVVTKALPPSAPNAAVVFSGGRVLAAEAPRVELPGAIRAFRGGQSTNVPKAIVNPAPTLQPSEAVMMLLLQAADPTSMQFGPGALREWSAQSAFPVDAHETERDQIKIMMESVEMGGMALSVGVVWWASRVTGLIGSLIASMPAWSQLDPLHIVGRDKEEEELDEAQDPDADADELAVAMVFEGPQARAGA